MPRGSSRWFQKNHIVVRLFARVLPQRGPSGPWCRPGSGWEMNAPWVACGAEDNGLEIFDAIGAGKVSEVLFQASAGLNADRGAIQLFREWILYFGTMKPWVVEIVHITATKTEPCEAS